MKETPDLPLERMIKMVAIQNVEPLPQGQKTLLEERHWNAIIFPGCYAKNWEYYQDAENAYRTSVERGGQGCRDNSWAEQFP